MPEKRTWVPAVYFGGDPRQKCWVGEETWEGRQQIKPHYKSTLSWLPLWVTDTWSCCVPSVEIMQITFQNWPSGWKERRRGVIHSLYLHLVKSCSQGLKLICTFRLSGFPWLREKLEAEKQRSLLQTLVTAWNCPVQLPEIRWANRMEWGAPQVLNTLYMFFMYYFMTSFFLPRVCYWDILGWYE